uniref:Uncharacterized protein n=1 Tax=Sinocyclocheilus grahami TaxID=75366 RepID=A0A672LZD2_SINGR
MVINLNNLSDLRESRFGQPPPRHGLNLLWWFAHDCVQIDFNGRLTAECNPTNGAFGFHRFHNRDGLLPYSDLLYYEVGNLNSTDSLPDYVTENYTGYSDSSNTDRIIVSFGPRRRRFENVYVTQHSDQVHFDQNHTYRISTELIKDIQDLSREEFLREPTNHSEHISIDIHQETMNDSYQISYQMHCRHTPFSSPAQSVKSEPYQSQESKSIKDVCAKCCKMLFCMFLFIFVVFFLLLIMKI